MRFTCAGTLWSLKISQSSSRWKKGKTKSQQFSLTQFATVQFEQITIYIAKHLITIIWKDTTDYLESDKSVPRAAIRQGEL